MTGKFTINAVDRAGVPWEVCMTDHADSAALLCNSLSLSERRTNRLYWVTLTDDPERGQVDPLDDQEWDETIHEETCMLLRGGSCDC